MTLFHRKAVCLAICIPHVLAAILSMVMMIIAMHGHNVQPYPLKANTEKAHLTRPA